MTKRLVGFAFSAFGVSFLVVACSGSSSSSITDPDGGASSSGSSGASSSGSSGASSSGSSGTSGVVCPPCEAPPSPDCKGSGPCGCGPYTCPDGGTTDGSSVACTWTKGANPCGEGKYCATATCGAGTCMPLPTTPTANDKDPQCGCDGITYWNATLAASAGMPLRSKGACTMGVSCGGIAPMPCPNGASCNHRVGSKDGCSIVDGGGTCWMMPATCPPIVVGVDTRACQPNKCADECTLVKSGAAFYPDNGCPQ